MAPHSPSPWLVLTLRKLLLLFLLRNFLGAALAQDCWKDTPCTGPREAAFPGVWESDIFAPLARTVTAAAVFDPATGQGLPGNVSLTGAGSAACLDFGVEVGGILTVRFRVSSAGGGSGRGALGVAFAEARDWVGPASDSSSGIFERRDGALYANFSAPGEYEYVMPDERLRGGFRYATLFLVDVGPEVVVAVDDVSLELSFQPTWANLRAYQGYFHSNDNLLNRIWYSGAYTLQTNAIHPSTGRAWPAPDSLWQNDGVIGPGDTIGTDGAKRDRTVWPGDMGVAISAAFYSTGDTESVRNSLRVLYDYQSPSGLLPFSGPPLLAAESDTYHMWTMIGTYNYVLYSGDLDFARDIWPRYLAGMSFLAGQFDPSLGLLNISGYANDWGRLHTDNTLVSAQVLYYRTLITGAALADWLGDTSGINSTWLEAASKLRGDIHERLWDGAFGAFANSIESLEQSTGLHPQDGNALAVLFDVAQTASDRTQAISSYLTRNWTPIGAECPELPTEISTFVSSFEIQAHLMAGQAQRALDLMRTSWGWYLNNENGTQSTMIEGYLTDGQFGYRWDAGYGGDYSYTSHSHGWATGPIAALTEHVLGLSVTGLAGSTWRIAPQFGDLTHVEGGFTTRLGKYSAAWTANSTGAYVLEYQVPEGTSGTLILPNPRGEGSQVAVDGEVVQQKFGESVEGGGGRRVYVSPAKGGRHRIEVS
ncbi:glycoside hydrolase family 78 protein [Durotheca rogersii]|uniref:glycoside hydrolase family 78 protein n=1 Tax=Durotheca rogersii TaxID=419775 RepID=UPI002220FE05|nr:glycoside hydrolase family 78 protein [Durotheca rogersii]KAI5866193.1 glycoside hydrolase family 78 protein [Durotheca rogersii]